MLYKSTTVGCWAQKIRLSPVVPAVHRNCWIVRKTSGIDECYRLLRNDLWVENYFMMVPNYPFDALAKTAETWVTIAMLFENMSVWQEWHWKAGGKFLRLSQEHYFVTSILSRHSGFVPLRVSVRSMLQPICTRHTFDMRLWREHYFVTPILSRHSEFVPPCVSVCSMLQSICTSHTFDMVVDPFLGDKQKLLTKMCISYTFSNWYHEKDVR